MKGFLSQTLIDQWESGASGKDGDRSKKTLHCSCIQFLGRRKVGRRASATTATI